jgi:hypothetical protein
MSPCKQVCAQQLLVNAMRCQSAFVQATAQRNSFVCRLHSVQLTKRIPVSIFVLYVMYSFDSMLEERLHVNMHTIMLVNAVLL